MTHPAPAESLSAGSSAAGPLSAAGSLSAAEWANAVDDDSRRLGKLAPQIAKAIESEVFRLGWPVGHPLGKEEELAGRFGVSRTVLREALTITERDGVTVRTRGRSGGVAIAAPAQASVAMALGNYLVAAGLSEQEFSDGYHMLNGLAFRLAAERCTAAQAEAARALMQRPLAPDLDGRWRHILELHTALLEMTGNRAVQIFSTAVVFSGIVRTYTAMATTQPAASLRFAEMAAATGSRQLDSVIAGDVADAVLAEREQLGLWRGYYRPAPTIELDNEQAARVITGINAVFSSDKPIKRADVLAFQLHQAIAAGRLRDGERLDSEAILLRRYQVSRGVLREAIRALERYAVVRTAEGRNGGLCVATPDPTAVVRSAVLYLRFLGLGAGDLRELGDELELAAASAAARQVAEQGPQSIEPFSQGVHFTVERVTPTSVQRHFEQIYAGLVAASGNAIFVLLMQALTAFLTIEQDEAFDAPLPDAAGYGRYLESMREVERALRRGDGVLARRSLLAARRVEIHIHPHPRDPRRMLDQMY